MKWPSRLVPAGIVTTIIAFVLVTFNDLAAYELITHAQISEAAFDRALEGRLNLRQYFDDIGIKSTDVFDPDSGHPELSAAGSVGFSGHPNDGTPRGWLAAGSIREDDYAKHVFDDLLKCPKAPNPESAIDRLYNHFFRVQTDGGGLPLVPPGSVSYPAPDWALGRQGHGTGAKENRFSLLDARVYQFRSLTSASRADRDRNTALLFRSLGHVVHVLQDMAQPQHVRDDPHPPCERVKLYSGKSWYEQYIENRAQGTPFRGRDVAPIPMAGYDAVQQPTYRDFWVNPSGSGLADVASRNFVSAGTNFGSSPPCKGLTEPTCDAQHPSYGRETLRDYTVTTLSGNALIADITFITRDFVDPISGAISPGVRVSSRSIWDEHLEQIDRRRFSLNTFNYDAMADVLLPRAAGYSAGLINLFFRGRLDIDLVNDATDPSLVRLSGVNLSQEPLANGALLLFTDEGSGQRTPVAAVDSTVISAEPAGAVVSGRFQPPAAAERFFAVYAGSLGAETPTQDSPGAVIGKKIGGTRVEQVFSDGNRWNVRTPDGIFPLPILATDIQELVWGDLENMLVGRTAFGAGAPSAFAIFLIDREDGAASMPLDSSGQVRLRDANPPRVSFPFGLSLGAQVVLNHTIQFRQYLPAVFRDATVEAGGRITAQTWDFDSALAVNATQTVPLTYQLTLDLDKFNNSRAEPHFWRLRQIGASADGHVLALVTSNLQLRTQTAFFETKKYSDVCSQWPCPQEAGPARGIPVRFPTPSGTLGTTIVAVIDVTAGTVRYSTAPPTLALTHSTSHVQFGSGADATNGFVSVREVRRQTIAGFDPFFFQVAPYNAFTCNPNQSFVELGAISTVTGTPQVSVALYQPELAPIVGAATTTAFSFSRSVCLPDPPGPLADPALPRPTFHITTDNYVADVPRTVGGLRAAQGPDRLALVFQHGVFPIVVWDPSPSGGVGRAALRGTHREAGGFIPSLLSTSREKTTIDGDDGLVVVALEGTSSYLLFPMDFNAAQSFKALEPAFLFRVGDGKFYRTVPLLEQTALPRTLAPGAPAAGSYHTLRLQ